MRSCCALYVDAGYLLAASATRVTGTSLRGSVTADHAMLIAALTRQATTDSGLPLLRVNWYDSAAAPGGGPGRVQSAIGMLDQVKLRLGRLSPAGEQKGVDLRLGLDLAGHARNHVADVFYLVSGDDDLAEAVEEAQSHGVQVILIAIPNADGLPHGVSRHLQREADGLLLADGDAIDAAVTPATASPTASRVPPPTAAGAATPTPASLAGLRARATSSTKASTRRAVYSTETGLDDSHRSWNGHTVDQIDELIDVVAHRVVDAYFATADSESTRRLLANRPFIPGDLDRALLNDLSNRLGIYEIEDWLRHQLRDRFWDIVDRRISRPGAATP